MYDLPETYVMEPLPFKRKEEMWSQETSKLSADDYRLNPRENKTMQMMAYTHYPQYKASALRDTYTNLGKLIPQPPETNRRGYQHSLKYSFIKGYFGAADMAHRVSMRI